MSGNVIVQSEKDEQPRLKFSTWSAKQLGLDLIQPGVYDGVRVSEWYNTGYSQPVIMANATPKLVQYLFNEQTNRLIGYINITRSWGDSPWQGGYDPDGDYYAGRGPLGKDDIAHRIRDMKAVNVEGELAFLLGDLSNAPEYMRSTVVLLASLNEQLRRRDATLTNSRIDQGVDMVKDSNPWTTIGLDYKDTHAHVQVDIRFGDVHEDINNIFNMSRPNALIVGNNLSPYSSHGRWEVLGTHDGQLTEKFNIAMFNSYRTDAADYATLGRDLTVEELTRYLDGMKFFEPREVAEDVLRILSGIGRLQLIQISRNINESGACVSLRVCNATRDEATVNILI